jgi:hypothetical protein
MTKPYPRETQRAPLHRGHSCVSPNGGTSVPAPSPRVTPARPDGCAIHRGQVPLNVPFTGLRVSLDAPPGGCGPARTPSEHCTGPPPVPVTAASRAALASHSPRGQRPVRRAEPHLAGQQLAALACLPELGGEGLHAGRAPGSGSGELGDRGEEHQAERGGQPGADQGPGDPPQHGQATLAEERATSSRPGGAWATEARTPTRARGRT